MTTITEQVAAIQKLAVPELVAEYIRLFGRPPHCRNRTWLWRNVAWKVQEQHYGGLPQEAQARLEEIIRTEIEPRYGAGKPVARPARELAIGTVLMREWHGEQVRLQVTDAGYVVGGVPYKSLSAAAHAVTGQHWSGKLFWGLVKRPSKAAKA